MDHSKKMILVVDDSAFHLARFRELLSESNFEILECTSGLEAVEILKSKKDGIDLLITDLEMPKMSGFELLRWVKEQPFGSEISTLVLTGAYNLTEVVDSLKELGVNGVLEKGGHPHHILARVNAIMYPEIVEKRKYDRVSVRMPVDFKWKDRHFDAEITNISLGGCFLLTQNLAKADEEITVLVTLPIKEAKLKLSGSIIWVVGGDKWGSKRRHIEGMGVKWKNLPDEDRLILEIYIEECLKTERLYYMLSP